MDSLYLLTVLIFSFFRVQSSKGADPFECLLVRYQCFGSEQIGCSTDFIDGYPEFSLSYNKMTRADTNIYMFTPNNPEIPELWHKCKGLLPPGTKFNPRCPTEFIIPGWLTGVCNVAITREIKNELLKKGCYNVILVDYMWGNSFDYIETSRNIHIVADQIAEVIRILKRKFNLAPKDFTCTGHSFGAQTCGLIGYRERIATINGLDPAGGVITENTPLEQRLDASDAECVQVIHTDGNQCFPSLGCNFTCGTVDIWPNGGLVQKGQVEAVLRALAKQDFLQGIANILAFSHTQAFTFYKASINPESEEFVAVRCQSYEDFKRGKCSNCGRNGRRCIVMGADACDYLRKTSLSGRSMNFYLETDATCPFINNSKINLNGFQYIPKKRQN